MTMEELQREKLKLEIGDLNRQWYKRKDYLQILLPTTIALFSLLYAVFSGFFSTKYDKFELQKEQLKLDILYFEQKKEILSRENLYLSTLSDSLKKSLFSEKKKIQDYKSRVIRANSEISEKENELNELKSKKVFYDDELKLAQTEFTRKKRAFESELQKQYLNESDLNRVVNVQKNTITQLKGDIERLKYNIEVLHNNPFVPSVKKIEFEIWEGKEMIEYFRKISAKLEEDRQRLQNEAIRSGKKIDTLNSRFKAMKIIN